MKLLDALSWRGTVGRRDYAVAGTVLLLVKYNLDRLVSEGIFRRSFSPLSYLDVTGVGRITTLSVSDVAYCAALVALAVPFIWIGTALTLRRLRAIGVPGTLVVLFFVPLLNLIFFAVLSAVPSGEVGRARETGGRALLERLVPESKLGSAAMSLGLTLPAGLLGAYVTAHVFASYGWSLFVGIPFALGLVAALLYSVHSPRTIGECVGVATLSAVLLALGLAALGAEGAICLLMAAPLGITIAAIGGAFGYALQQRHGTRAAPPTVLAVSVVVPLLIGVEVAGPETPPLIPVRTSVEIAASPETVWEHVVAFAELPPPEDWLFKTGIAYPIRATIEGTGVGAVRRCEFTTGAFVEPVTVWEPGRRLAFTVEAQPQPMREWGFYEHVEPHHLNGYFVSERGQFLLIPLPGGGTRLEGTTWYRHHVWPNAYWQLWSDAILHRIHLRVLRHVRTLSEADQ
ncbi:MAG: SRPBCC family protein [Bacteroidota bacterium]